MKESTKQIIWAMIFFLLLLICAGAVESNPLISFVCLVLCVPCIIFGHLDKCIEDTASEPKEKQHKKDIGAFISKYCITIITAVVTTILLRIVF